MNPSPFKIKYSDSGELMFEAEFLLPTDGTPDSYNKLRVQVIPSPDQQRAEVQVYSTTGYSTTVTRNRLIAEGCINVGDLGDVLYGAARVRYVAVVEPIE